MRKLFSKIVDEACHRHDEKSGVVGEETMRRFEKQVLLQILDHTWKEHLAAMDYLRQGIHLRGTRKRIQKQEYKREAFELFTSMLDQIKRESVRVLTAVQVPSKEEIEAQEEERRRQAVEQLARVEATHENVGYRGFSGIRLGRSARCQQLAKRWDVTSLVRVVVERI